MKAQHLVSEHSPDPSIHRGNLSTAPIAGDTLTLRQQEVFEFVARFKDERGVPPTLREVAGHFGFRSTTAAADHLRALRRKGYLKFAPRQARSHQLFPTALAPRPTLTEVPIYTLLPDGHENHEPEGSLTVDTEQFGLRRGERLQALRVRGETGSPQVLDGDIVLLSRMRKPESGAVVAARLGGKTALMTFVVREGRPFLRKISGEPETLPADEFFVQGVMVGLVRPFQRAHTAVAEEPLISAKPGSDGFLTANLR